MLASILLAACMVPEQLHLTEIVVDRAAAGAIAQRLKHESFRTVATSIPSSDQTGTGYHDSGWVTRDQLKAADRAPFASLMVREKAERAAAASLRAGGTTTVDAAPNREFVHLEEVRPAMSCDRAVARYPHDELALTTRAAWHRQTGNSRAAVADYSAVIRFDPKSGTALYGRALTYYRMGEYAHALDDVNAFFATSSGDANAYTLRGLIEEARGDDDLATADEGYAIAQYRGWGNDDSGARYALGVAYEDLGYFAAAIEEFDATLNKSRANTFSYMPRAFAWFSRGELTKASDDFIAASRANPRSGRPYLGLAMVSYSKGDAAAALGFARRALTADPHDAYAALWVLVSTRALHRSMRTSPAESFANSARWPAAAIKVFLDRAPVESLEAAAASSPDTFTQREQLCEARFYAAAFKLAAGDRVQALPLLRLAADECPFREYERAAAEQLLRGQ